MRNRIFGAIGILWGGSGLLFNAFHKKHVPVRVLVDETSRAYTAGGILGTVLLTIMLIAGLYYFIKGNSTE